MSDCRDWLSTLWPASYKGFPFYFASDNEEGGLGLVIHEFPHRDDPFVEDLGESPRFYSGSGYIHGDNVDLQTAAFKAALVSHGPGILTVPIVGPVPVRLQSFKRSHERDKLGFVAFDLKFVREGAAVAVISVPLAANIAFGAAAALAALIAPTFAQALAIAGQAEHVVTAAANGVATAAAALDAIRTTTSVDPAVSAKLRDTLAGVVEQAPQAITAETVAGAALTLTQPGADALDPTAAPLDLVPTTADVVAVADALIGAARDLADAMAPEAASAAMLDMVAAFSYTPAPLHLAPSDAVADANGAAAARLARLAALTAYAESVLRRTFASRPEGVTARAVVAERFELELDAVADGADDYRLFLAIQDLRDGVTDYLSRLINDLAPVVTVEAPLRMPSLFWGWRLYADPLRAAELVARNAVRHPSFMPQTFQALAR